MESTEQEIKDVVNEIDELMKEQAKSRTPASDFIPKLIFTKDFVYRCEQCEHEIKVRASTEELAETATAGIAFWEKGEKIADFCPVCYGKWLKGKIPEMRISKP